MPSNNAIIETGKLRSKMTANRANYNATQQAGNVASQALPALGQNFVDSRQVAQSANDLVTKFPYKNPEYKDKLGAMFPPVKGYAKGGEAKLGSVKGPGTETSDSIPAQLSKGEFVVSAEVVKAYGVDFFNNLVKQVTGAKPPPPQVLGGRVHAANNLNTDDEEVPTSAQEPVIKANAPEEPPVTMDSLLEEEPTLPEQPIAPTSKGPRATTFSGPEPGPMIDPPAEPEPAPEKGGTTTHKIINGHRKFITTKSTDSEGNTRTETQRVKGWNPYFSKGGEVKAPPRLGYVRGGGASGTWEENKKDEVNANNGYVNYQNVGESIKQASENVQNKVLPALYPSYMLDIMPANPNVKNIKPEILKGMGVVPQQPQPSNQAPEPKQAPQSPDAQLEQLYAPKGRNYITRQPLPNGQVRLGINPEKYQLWQQREAEIKKQIPVEQLQQLGSSAAYQRRGDVASYQHDQQAAIDEKNAPFNEYLQQTKAQNRLGLQMQKESMQQMKALSDRPDEIKVVPLGGGSFADWKQKQGYNAQPSDTGISKIPSYQEVVATNEKNREEKAYRYAPITTRNEDTDETKTTTRGNPANAQAEQQDPLTMVQNSVIGARKVLKNKNATQEEKTQASAYLASIQAWLK